MPDKKDYFDRIDYVYITFIKIIKISILIIITFFINPLIRISYLLIIILLRSVQFIKFYYSRYLYFSYNYDMLTFRLIILSI